MMMLRAIAVVVVFGLAALPASGQTSAQFQIPVTVTSSTSSQMLYIGVSGDGEGGVIQDNTIGADVDPSFGAYQELVAPPAPPAPYAFDVRILTIPGRVSTFPTGLGGGVYRDFRGFRSAAQVDSFRINMSGDNIDVVETVISWPAGLSQHFTAAQIRPQSGGEWAPVDMLTATSVNIPVGVLQKNTLIITTGALGTDVRQTDDAVPAEYALAQNFPNPFNPATEIRFSLAEAGRVTLTVFNLLGQQVASVVDGEFAPGSYTARFDAAGLASGIYLYRLAAKNFVQDRKMVVLK